METKMKGLLKGLRYISQIFDSKEPEMQIGYPTDVKHVAHIGWDNQPINNSPSWMNDYRPGDPNPRGAAGPENWPPSGFQNDYQGREFPQDKHPTRPPRRTSSGDTASPKNAMSPSHRQTQRRHSASSSTTGNYDASSQVEPSDGSGRYRSSRSRNVAGDSQQQSDVPIVPKQNRRRKTNKGSSGGGSGKSKSKGGASPAQELEADDQVAMTNMGSVLATNTNR